MNDYLLAPEELVELGITTVIIATPDLQGRLVGRRVPVENFPRVIEDGIEICTCAYSWDLEQSLALIEANKFALCSMHNGLPDISLKVDLGTLRRAAWLDNVAVCFADPWDPRAEEFLPISPRTILRTQIDRLSGLGLRAQTGTELEFYLFLNEPRALRKSGFRDLDPTTLIPSDFMIHEGNGYEWFFQKLRADLAASGIEMEAAQSEWGTGQWEMTFRYQDPLEMADRHALYKLAVRDSAAAAGMSATFMAKPLNAGQPGSSCHVHLSVVDDERAPVFWSDADEHHLSPVMRQSMAGVLAHVDELLALYAPTVNSYRRTNSADVAGWGSTWSIENRTTSVRVVGHRPRDRRFEFRLPGADTNPYLTLAGLLASVRDGIENARELPPRTEGNGYDTPLASGTPRHLGEAATAFAASAFTAQEFGAEVVAHMAVLLHDEWNQFLGAVSDWDLHRYFDRI
ncbi:glutamine synthetase family protein [Microbacterium trichothecenolyticum]|uniref:Glutamine synthetase n=1 Tax=Microbacterium trichothecenolyticum TaxID=69370 RepID=A0ABU0TQR9_MICTR|nr:glutamine synthetase family protein [Microbacterium trichothecenolyticum]MDQ1122017.1 glutamine synthetase [Microbacterium trichothecenolyticum]